MKPTSLFPEESQLWQDFLTGDIKAFERLMSGSFRFLFSYGSRFSKDREFVKDSIQDLFLTLWEKKENLNPEAAVRPYLMASLRRLMHRRSSARSWVGGEPLGDDDDYFDIEFSVEEEYIENEAILARTRQLEKFLNALPRRQKEVVYLKFFQELSREQISEVMAVSPQTVSNLLQMALKYLKMQWKAELLTFLLFYFLF